MVTSVQADLAAGIETAVGEGGFGAKDYEPHKETVLRLVEAIVRRRRCDLRYRSPANPTTKRYEFEPYRLLTVSGALYCLGRVPPYENVATLAVDRIQTLDMTDATFVVDPSFDAARYQRESFGIIWEKPMNVVIRFSADQAPYVRERVWHSTQRIRKLRDGRVELRFRAGGAFEIARWVLGWGDDAEVIRPALLRARLAQILESAAHVYSRVSNHAQC